MFARVHEMGVFADPSTPVTPFVVCYLCSYIDGEGGSALAWVMDDVLRIASPQLHADALQHGWTPLTLADRRRIPPIPSARCPWLAVQKRAVLILAHIDDAPSVENE